MFHSSHSLETRHRAFSFRLFAVCAVLLVIIFAPEARAQANGGIDTDPGDRGTGGKNIINGFIYDPSGRRIDRRLRVTVQSVQFGQQAATTDTNGAFTLRRLRGGTYYITVDAGPEYEPVSERVDIIDPGIRQRNNPGQTVTVQINLRPKFNPVQPAGTVNAALAGVPEEAREMYKKAMEAAQSGDEKKAIELLNDALALHPAFMLAHNELGVQHLRLKKYDKAIESFLAALKIDAEAFVPRLNFGIALFHKKEYQTAATELNRVTQKDISSASAQASAHFYLGRACIYIGNYDQAEKSLQQTIRLGGDESVEAHRFLGAVYIEKGDSLKAAESLEKYLTLAPKTKDAEQVRKIIKQLRSQAGAK